MIKGKIASIAFGGLAGFMLISRAFGLVENSIRNICEANKWKNYYKYGKDGNVVAPGYSMHTHKIDDDHEIVVEDERQKTNENQQDAAKKVADTISKAVDKIFDEKKEEALPDTPDTDGDNISYLNVVPEEKKEEDPFDIGPIDEDAPTEE